MYSFSYLEPVCCSMSSSNLLPDLHIGFSRGQSGSLVFPSLSEFSTVYCEPHRLIIFFAAKDGEALYSQQKQYWELIKGLGLIDRVPDELWMEVHHIVQETGMKTIPKKRNAKKQNGCLRRPYK